MKLYQVPEYPRRVYIDATEEESNKLFLAFFQKFEINPSHNHADVESIFFSCDKLDKVYFPLGIVNIVSAIASQAHVTVDELELLPKEYDTEAGAIIKDTMLDGITLRDYQMQGTHAGLYHKGGLLQIPTGGGKTEMMSAVTRYLLDNKEGNILIGVPSTNLLTQTYERLKLRGIPESEMSMLGGGHGFDPKHRVIISTVQSAYNRIKKAEPEFMEWVGDVVGLLMDEAHHGSARTWFTIVDGVKAEYVLGFSAEPFYNDASHVIKDLLLRGSLGSVLYRIPLKVLIQRGYLSHPYVFAMRSNYNGNIQRLSNWQTVQKTGIIQNTQRNALIVEVVDWLIKMEKNPLVLIQQINHGRHLADLMSRLGYRIALLTGGQSVTVFQDGMVIEEYQDVEDRAKREFSEGIIDALLGTSVMDEGVDMPSLASVVLAGGGKSKLKLIQRIGRGLRPKEGDNTTFIFDFVDGFNRITHNQFKERKEQFDKQEFDTFFVNDMLALDTIVNAIRERRVGS